jgi:hypothetical protein
MKKSNDTIGNRTRDLPALSPLPQPTAPPRDPYTNRKKQHFFLRQSKGIYAFFFE